MSEKRHRDLNDIEQKIMYEIYCRNKGNHSKCKLDSDSLSKDDSVIGYWAKKYEWKAKYLKDTQESLDRQRKKWQEKLEAGKQKAIEMAIDLLEVREEPIETKDGIKNLIIRPSNKDVKCAYEIIKVELNEPTTIRENLNKTDIDKDTQKILDFINEGINSKDDTTDTSKNKGASPDNVSTGKQTSNNPAEIPTSV
jgi:hypothetical protein